MVKEIDFKSPISMSCTDIVHANEVLKFYFREYFSGKLKVRHVFMISELQS
ncbi:protein of unknown function [Vibrio tapetis subsp. tapetis]|uniref:Uncharacterized protein n=1 Tax=Vibrio tapetis subsp. tapetis TaxID=1671868 RepID=A0A2N8ZEF6_9VIBR|nr:protein of unknown function [Vibrio tapetis subsp. tapetis]